jgi:hypothetical protein
MGRLFGVSSGHRRQIDAPFTGLLPSGKRRPTAPSSLRFRALLGEFANHGTKGKDDSMKHLDKQKRPASKKDMPLDKLQPASDVSPHAAKGGDKESHEPLPRPLKGSEQPGSTTSGSPPRNHSNR